jgi:2-methylcitrate dehydratase PrpD
MQTESQTSHVSRFIATARDRTYPDQVMDAAKQCLVDWVAVCAGAYNASEAQLVSRVISQWNGSGESRFLWGGTSNAGATALVNGTLSHCLDYDDTHIPSVIHISGPLWATVLAIGSERGVAEDILLKAFITGFEIAARLGDKGTGIRLNDGGWHATPALGGVGAAAAAAVLLDLDESRIEHALGIAATQTGGLTASFGTMSKPFHVGKVAMDAVLAVQLAAEGFKGPLGILDQKSKLLSTLLQDPTAQLDMAPFEDTWEITRNSFKPYAACQLTHGAIDAARAAVASWNGRAIDSIRAHVNPLAIKIAGLRNASTSTEGKFSMGFCIALALHGYPITIRDFAEDRLADPALRTIAERVALVSDENVSRTAARLEIKLADGQVLTQTVEHAFGSIGNPLGWPELDEKFIAVVSGAISGDANELLATLHRFEQPGSMARMFQQTTRAGHIDSPKP